MVDIRYCANDNSASIINMLVYAYKNKDFNIGILDSEEAPYLGGGSGRLSRVMTETGQFRAENIFNLELTGVGRNLMISKNRTNTSQILIDAANAIEVDTPFSDSTIFNRNGFDSECLFLLPDDANGRPDFQYMYYCHTSNDHEGIINIDDMKWFVEEVIPKFIVHG